MRGIKKPGIVKPKSLKNTVIRSATVIGLAAASFSMLAPAASASGTSGVTNGCYGQWWNTAFEGKCDRPHVTVSGRYRLVAYCDTDTDYTGKWVLLSKGSKVIPFDKGECTWEATWANVHFTNGS
jgi:hypothetical protein